MKWDKVGLAGYMHSACTPQDLTFRDRNPAIFIPGAAIAGLGSMTNRI